MATEFNTLNNLLAALQDIATRHKQINSFGVGDEFEIGVSQALIHPVLWVNPVAASMDKGDNGYTSYDIDFNVRVFDLVNKDESNENEVLSDAFEILKDVVTEFNTHPYYIESAFNIKDTLNFTPFTEKYDEEVSGWEVVMRLEAPNKRSFCGIPVEPITNYGSYTGGCNTTVIDTSSQDIYVTGFTYDNANTFTIYDNSGSTFSASINLMTGLTVNGSVSATTYYGDGSNLTGLVIPTGYWTAGTGTNSIISINQNHTANGNNSLIGGGEYNLAAGERSVVLGGGGISKGVPFGNTATTLADSSVIAGGKENIIDIAYSFIGGGVGNTIDGTISNSSAILGGQGNTLTGLRSVILGGQLITGSADDTVFVPYFNISSLSATTSATTFNDLVVGTDGSVMTNQLFNIGLNFTVTAETWNYTAPEDFKINSYDNPSGLTVDIQVGGSGYTLGTTINQYAAVTVDVDNIGFINLKCEEV